MRATNSDRERRLRIVEKQIHLSEDARADAPDFDKVRDDGTHEVGNDLAYKRLAIVNIVFVGVAGAGDGNWVLIDTGLPFPGSTGMILRAASARFGENSRPAAIVQTHAHFDHTGALEELAKRWDVPVYAHQLEIPYLNGMASYPPPDPKVGGGMMSILSPLYPRGPVNVARWLRPLPADGRIPVMPGWRWVFTPGHTPGHVSFWRQSDRALIAGDAFITTRQESAYAAITQEFEMHGPPAYYTQNWDDARSSVERLAALQPQLAITGHGRAAQGQPLRRALSELARNFARVAVPKGGHYVETPAKVQDGSAYDR